MYLKEKFEIYLKEKYANKEKEQITDKTENPNFQKFTALVKFIHSFDADIEQSSHFLRFAVQILGIWKYSWHGVTFRIIYHYSSQKIFVNLNCCKFEQTF